VTAGRDSFRERAEQGLWPRVAAFVDSYETAGLAVAVVSDEEVVARGYGVRDVRTGAPVTPQTMFHLASVSKPFVATAIVSLAMEGGDGHAALDLDAPITDWVPEFTLADGRAAAVTARTLLSHTSGLPDLTEYGWHEPQLGDDALSELARSLSHWRLETDPGTTFSYSNAGFELLGLLLSRVMDTTFEDAVRQRVLLPLGMQDSTFLRADVPEHLASSPHVGMPLTVLDDAYPYTRRHAPSSTLHSNLDELCRWMVAHFAPVSLGADDARDWARLGPALVDRMREPVAPVGRPPWEESAALGWAVGSYRGEFVLSHSGADPGFGSKLVLVPDRRTGVAVLANSNTVPTGSIAAAALDVVLSDVPLSSWGDAAPDELGDGFVELHSLLPPVTRPVAEALTTHGAAYARETFGRLAGEEPVRFDLDDEVFIDAVWGAIELHHTELVWPLLRVWTDLRPDSSDAWTMTGWAHQVDGRPDQARQDLRHALDLDPGNEEAAQILGGLP
jgi:CubicO group peptidase (beta-lactamase class C family)